MIRHKYNVAWFVKGKQDMPHDELVYATSEVEIPTVIALKRGLDPQSVVVLATLELR